ncbi:BspA family leucine-rich repeat surface protein [Psychroserpens luteolus]|uniref:BspA family leucine-rich repeat surface protein n=1 Tax=Psychroserpens luteolus TaxID=2855840 RepID=UPI001E2F493A|nr:BspA family leucine-rich repeat surface protein [Psychroserpens luteolus]MCD2259449.1 BspA family leucine-rich repeat surface protein [Psychroserpens luteolus]
MNARTPLVLLCVFFFWSTNIIAQCDGTNDIIQDDFDNDLPSFLLPAGNSFTATCSGKIEGISFWTRRVTGGTIGGVSVTLELWSQPLSSSTRTLINSQTLDLPFSGSQQEHYFQFNNESSVNSGELYAFRVVKNDNDKTVDLRTHEATDVYPGGEIFTGNFWNFDPISEDWDIRFQVHYLDEVRPIANCRNITRTLGTNGTVNISPSNINNNSTDADSGIASFGISQNSFDCDDIGDNTVTLFLMDQNGNSASCQATVTILDQTAPELTCPGDMTVFTDPGVPAVVNYDDILYDDCSVETPSGFDLLGVWNGKSYFLSQNSILPSQAYSNAESLGGYVATIENAEHNEFIRSAVSDAGLGFDFLIGYNDIDVEDTFVWHDPNATSTYSNWSTAEPNDAGAGEDYTTMNGGGRWNDRNNNNPKTYLIELSQSTITQTTGLTSGSVFPLGTTTNTFEATDGFGNVGTCEFDVTVVENPFETLVELSGGKLTITDIENDSDDQITLSNDGITLTISDLVVPTVSGSGVIKTDATTVTVPMSNITNGIEFIGGNGDNSISIDSDININGDFDIKNISAYAQNGAITITGAFKVSESIALDLIIQRALTADSFNVTGINSLTDQSPGYPITITGTTNIQTTENVDISLGATAPHTFGGLVTISAESFYVASSQSLELGTITSTDTDDSRRNEIYVGSGDLTLTADIVTGGDSDLYLRAENTINKPSGTITTDKLVFDGSDNGDTVALFFGNNDINIIEVETGRTMGLIVFNDIDDMEIGLLTIGDASLFASTMNLTENTDILKNGTGALTIGTETSTINITNPTNNSVANIEHNAGFVEFFGSTITVEKLNYRGVSGTRTRFLDGNTTFNDLDLSLEFGTLAIHAPLNIGFSGINIEVFDELLIDRFNSVLSGAGTFTGTSTTVELDGTIAPGNGTTPSTLTIQSVEFDEGTFAPFIDSDDAFDQLNVVGTVTLTDADFAPTGGFSNNSDIEEIIIVNNDGSDAISGTFNGLPEGSQVNLTGTSDIITISYVGGDGNDITLSRDLQAPVIICPADQTIDCTDAATVFAAGISVDTPIDIPDNDDTGISSTANITGIDSDLEVSIITVQVAIDHTWTGDLSIDLIAPGGETAVLFAESLSESSNLNSNFPITFTDTAGVSADDIGETIENSEAACETDNICEYTAMGGVDAFAQLINAINTNGSSFNGDWTLSLRDQAGQDTGTLVSWQINIEALDPDAVPGVINTDPSAMGIPTATDASGTPTITFSDVLVNGCGISQTITRTWTATDTSENSSNCVQTITITDTAPPVLDSCPEDIIFELAPSDTDAIITYDLPTASDVCGDVAITQTEGLASGEVFPEGITTNTFSITDVCGNETICSFTVTVTFPETLVSIDSDVLTIEDVNGGVSDDDFTLSDDGTTLTISNLTAPLEVSGGPVLVDDTTVTVDMSLFTGGIIINTKGGTNAVTVETSSATAIDIQGDDTAIIGLDAINTGDLNIVGFIEIIDVGSAITVTGVSTFSASGQIALNDGEGNHSFGGAINIDANRITFSAGANITFSEITISATDPLQNFLVASPGTVTLDGNVSVTNANTNLFIASNDGIFQHSGIINQGFLILRGNGSGTAVLDQANTVGAIAAVNPINTTESAFTNLSFTNATNTFLADIVVDEFTLTAPQFDLEPNFTLITKHGSGTSTFNADIDINNGTGTAVFNHNAGTINFNGATNDFSGRVTYNGAAGTITNLNSDVTGFPGGGPGKSFTFGTLNGTGNIGAGDIIINILDAANFSGENTLLTGLPFVEGALATISNDATITPGGGTTGFDYTFDDLLINTGGTFAPRIVGDGVGPGSDFDSLTTDGTITLDDANLAPTGGFIAQMAGDITIITNNGPDSVSGTFNGLPEGASISFGNYNGIISYVGGDGNDVTLSPDPNNLVSILISEYQPVTFDADTPQTIEFKGPADESFSGAFVIIDGDNSRNGRGVVTDVSNISGDFNADGILTVTVPNLTNPTHTAVLVSSFSGTVDVTDIDTDNDGVADDLSSFGTVFDAVGVGDGGACCPVSVTYGTDFGGVNLSSIGSIPGAIFREGSIGDFFQISASNSNIYDNTGTVIDGTQFNVVPTEAGTYGQINPSISLGMGTDIFVTTWKTDNSGSSADNQITIFTDSDETYSYNIVWGDGTSNLNVTGDITHTYTTAGTYTIGITGTFPRFISNGSFFGDAEKLISIDQWGTNTWSSFEEAFVECENMELLATDTPDLSNVTSLYRMFDNCQTLTGNATINNWNVSNVQNMQLMFASAFNFNQPLNNWNVGNVTNMTSMFNTAESFNQNLNSWNTSQVEFMDFMFTGALDFNGATGNWNVANVTDMSWMFNNAEDFNQDLNSWNVSQVLEMDFMFLGATNFDGNISNWNTVQVTTMYAMFQNAVNFNQDISGWNVGLVTDMGWMFNGATNFNQDISGWNVSNVAAANAMLVGTAFSIINYDQLLTDWSQLSLQNDVSFGTDASYCFGESGRNTMTDPSGFNWTITDSGLNCDSFFITKWKTDNAGNSGDNQVKITTVTSETYNYTVFWGDGTSNSGVTGDITHTYTTPGTYTVSIAGTFPRITTNTPNTPGDTSDKLKLIEVVQWGSNPWTSMDLAFSGCRNLDVTATDTPDLSNATSMFNMFADCTSLVGTSAFNSWDVSTITDMLALFFNTTLFDQDISNWNVSAAETMEFMFMFADNFNQDISGWNVSSVTSMEDMFNSATNFDQDLGNWDISSLQTAEDMFANAGLSTNNYDKLLIGWNTLNTGETQIPSNITFNAGSSQYCLGEAARTTLTDITGLNWTINDAGSSCNDAFITTWKTDNQGGTNDNSIRIPATNATFNYNVDWGDGTVDIGVTGLIEHTYSAAGTYDVTITGDFPRILFNNAMLITTGSLQPGADRLKIIEVKQWGTISWSTMDRAFYGCENLDVTATDLPDLSNVTKLTQIFNNCYNLVGTTDINSWDVSTIDDMRSAFAGARLFNQPLNNWNMSNVTQIFSMFTGAEVFNQPLNNWNVSNVDNMGFLFTNAKSFNQNIDNWNVSNVTEMTSLFHGAEDFDQPLNSWNVSNVRSMNSMFHGAITFNQPLNNWNVSKVENFIEMFSGASRFNQNINNWNVSDAEFMLRMFQNAKDYDQPMNNWNVSKVRSMWGMFSGATIFNQPINNWDVAEVEQMKDMFANATAFDQELSSWDLSSMVSGNLGMAGMFTNAGISLENYDNTLIGWATLDTGETQIPTNVLFEGGSSQYCASETQRQDLIDTYGWTIDDSGLNCPTTIYVVPYVYLQGAALNPNAGEENLMRDDLRVAGLLPITSPYGDGATVDASVFVTTGNDAIVDWVWVELRDKDNSTIIVAEKSGLLQRDGDVLGTGLTALSFDLPIDDYYVVIKHRNHLGIMSASTVSLFTSPLVVDFTDGSVPTYGTNAQTTLGMPIGVQGLWAGDANGDDIIQYSGGFPDTSGILSTVLNDATNFLGLPTHQSSGYSNSDVNMDGIIQYAGSNSELPFILQNVFSYPGNFLGLSTWPINAQLPTNLSRYMELRNQYENSKN